MTLNIWGGRVYQPLIDFISNQKNTDIFCFQEVYHNADSQVSTEDNVYHLDIFSEIENVLPKHIGYFRPAVNNTYGIAMFIKNSINVLKESEIIIHDNSNYPGKGPTHKRNLQCLECVLNSDVYSVFNMHGLWNGQGKSDSPDRILQSQRVKTFMDTINTPKILCGDFNLRPDTQSMRILNEGMVNLIERYQITSTRTALYPKEEKFADYVLASNEINVNQFKVLPDEISDHAALLVEFE